MLGADWPDPEVRSGTGRATVPDWTLPRTDASEERTRWRTPSDTTSTSLRPTMAAG